MECKRFLNSAGMLAAYAVFSYTEFNHKFFTRLFPPGDKKKLLIYLERTYRFFQILPKLFFQHILTEQ